MKNEEIMCSQEYLLITHFTHCAKDQQGLVEKKDITMLVCINTAHFCSDNFHFPNCNLNSIICPSHLSPIWSCKLLSMSKDSWFDLHQMHISKKYNDAFEFNYRGLLRRLDGIYAWLSYNYITKRSLTTIPTFQNHLLSP